MLILAIGSVGSFWIFSDYQRYQDAFDQWAQQYIKARKLETTALTNSGGGYVTYYWNKSGVDERYHREKGQKKIAYVNYFEPFDWIIGIGEYVEDVEEQVQQEVVERLNSIRHGEKRYIFTHTSDGICLSHVNQDNIGKNRWELLDARGLKVVQELNRVGRRPGGGFPRVCQ